MNQNQMGRQAALWGLIVPAAGILLLTMGVRQVSGLFISPINTATGIGIVGISFALAIGQFVWGASQPLFGMVADRYGFVPVLIAGTLMIALGTALTPLVSSQFGLILSLGILSAAGAGAGSFAILIGASASRIPAEKRSFASGVINAGGSLGQFIFAPLAERLIALTGWISAMFTLAALSLLALPLIAKLRTPQAEQPANQTSAAAQAATAAPAPSTPELGLRAQLRTAFGDRSYLLIHAGFFTCGFHIAFLITHLPGEIALCNLPTSVSGIAIGIIGLANIAGSLGAGALGARYRMKHLLFWVYLSRAVLVLLYLAAPKTAMTVYLFAAGLGLTWLSTIPPTAGLVGKLFGVRYLATLFGLTILTHQIGGFLGAWLGGISVATTGNFHWMFIADAALALFAALVHLPIREAPVLRSASA
ncbi:MAG: MFS transporter [Quisquiliibacterium sp.]